MLPAHVQGTYPARFLTKGTYQYMNRRPVGPCCHAAPQSRLFPPRLSVHHYVRWVTGHTGINHRERPSNSIFPPRNKANLGPPTTVSHVCFPPPPASESTDTQFFDTTRLDINKPTTTSPAAAQYTAFLLRQNQATAALDDSIIPLFTNPEDPTTDTHLADVQLPGP
ncbi:hypothetical protein CFIO01_04056 [Colletotrichum fioriniae PJ7]|uniref:Uncharacterized protein n=1 Tax=Colletotrichum fioriniae PJ7 TaxID=1445577 RepID=A0A010RAM3_9PEZI|nr:hypothetical protein CFIO01_04056 [Colletotrichum fioriniae PJ7]